MRIRDSIAERLEACGLYRRAASRWIEVMQRCLDDEDREWIRHHRNQCLKKAQRPPAPKEEFADLHQAAKETQYRMGIAKPYGEAFRLPGKGKTASDTVPAVVPDGGINALSGLRVLHRFKQRRPAQAQRRRAAGDRTEFDEESGCRKAKTRLLGGFFK
ncbi:PerC transcriptional activator [Klebsiella pneumoniae]|nr:PerC transcriptional activator [Klebsiella pneumoniae]